MSKATRFCTLIFFILLLAASLGVSRPVQNYSDINPMETNHRDNKRGMNREVEGNCNGEGEEEECLMRRTLEAHLDYIYTQKEKQP